MTVHIMCICKHPTYMVTSLCVCAVLVITVGLTLRLLPHLYWDCICMHIMPCVKKYGRVGYAHVYTLSAGACTCSCLGISIVYAVVSTRGCDQCSAPPAS